MRQRASSEHKIRSTWPPRVTVMQGFRNDVNKPLVKKENIILPLLHIKLGLMIYLLKALKHDGPAFLYLKKKFLKISDAKVKEVIPLTPQIRGLMRDSEFLAATDEAGLSVWCAFMGVCRGLFGKETQTNYDALVDELVKSFNHHLGCNTSIKLHFLHSHLYFFPENAGAVSNEHSERFHWHIWRMERRYKGKWNPDMLADCCWNLMGYEPGVSQKRQ